MSRDPRWPMKTNLYGISNPTYVAVQTTTYNKHQSFVKIIMILCSLIGRKLDLYWLIRSPEIISLSFAYLITHYLTKTWSLKCFFCGICNNL